MDAEISTSQLLNARADDLFDAAELHLVDAEEQELVDVVQPQAVDVRKRQLVHIGEQHLVGAKVAVTASTSSGPSACRQIRRTRHCVADGSPPRWAGTDQLP